MNDETTPPIDPISEANLTSEETTVEAGAQAEAAAETKTNPETQKIMPPLTPERVTDITFGLGKAAVDALDKAARQLDDSVRQIRQDAPGFFTEMEEKGRPVREKLSESLKNFSITDVFNKATGSESAPASDPAAALDDIEALENRVRELEQQVSSDPATEEVAPDAPKAPSPFSMLELDDEPLAEAKPKPEAKVKAATAPPKPAARRTKKKAEGETPAE